MSLGWMGPTAKDAIAELIETLSDSNPQVRDISGETLQKIGEPAKSRLLKAVEKAKRRWVGGCDPSPRSHWAD